MSLPYLALAHPSQEGWGRESEMYRWKNSWVKTIEQLKQKLHMPTRQNKEFIHHFPLSVRCLSLGNRASSCVKHTWEDRQRKQNAQMPPSSFFHRAFVVWNIPWGELFQLWPSQLLEHAQPPDWPGSLRGREILVRVWALLSTSWTSLGYQHFPAQIQNTVPCQLLWRKWTAQREKEENSSKFL